MIQSVWKNLTGLQKAAEHLCVTLNEPKTHHQTPMTCAFMIWTKVIWTLTNCDNKDGNIIHVLKNCISTSVATVLKCMKGLYPISTSHWCLVMSF